MTAMQAARGNPSQHKFSTRKNFPDQEQRDLFLSLFHRYGYIFKPINGQSTWQSANEAWELKPSEIFKSIACLHQRFYLGTRSGKFTRFAVFDIDARSRYHNKVSWEALRKVLIDAGLERFNLYRSSESSGWHVYIFFEEAVPAKELRGALVRLLTVKGFQVACGQLEVFPNPGNENTQGYGLRLPLQPGFAWLDERTLEVDQEREELSPAEALHKFISNLWDGNSYHDYRNLVEYSARLSSKHTGLVNKLKAGPVSNAIAIRSTPGTVAEASQEDLIAVVDTFGFVPPGMHLDTWVKGRSYAVTGLTAPSQRHDASFALNHYFFYGDPGRGIPALGYNHEDERFAIVQELLTMHHNGYSKQLERGQADAIANIRRQASWRPPSKRTAAATTSDVMAVKKIDASLQLVRQRANAKRSRQARQKISAAVNSLLEKGIQLSLSSIHTESGVAVSTIRRHPDLWKVQQENQYEELFAALSGEYNAVVQGGDSENPPLASATNKKEPGGLLAARQIVAELKMRGERERRKVAKAKEQGSQVQTEDWKAQIEKHLPESIRTADTVYLQFLQAMYGVSLATSPDYESQKWLEGIREEIQVELQQRCTAPEAVPLHTPEPGCAYQPYGYELDTG